MKGIPSRELIGSLLYLSNTTRPDLSYSVGLLARYMESPGEKHWKAAKHVLRYLRGTLTFGILYKNDGSDTIVGYTDSDFAADRDARKSTSGFCFLLSGGIVSWLSKKQSITAQSTVEAEFIALSFAVRELIWLRNMMKELEQNIEVPSIIFVDNQGCISLSESAALTDKSKHIAVKIHLVKDMIDDGTVMLSYLPTKQMAADVFTKLLPRTRHLSNRNQLGICEK